MLTQGSLNNDRGLLLWTHIQVHAHMQHTKQQEV